MITDIRSKKELRKEILNIRDNMDEQDREYMNARLKARILGLKEIADAGTVYIFASFGSEADMYPIMEELTAAGKKIAVPKVKGDDMEFFYITSKNNLAPGYRGIPEPVEGCVKADKFAKNDVIIVPGTAFDRNLFRMGYGKGFYDRFLSAHRELISIGAAYDFQVLDKIPVDEWDRSLSMVVTDRQVITY